MHTYAASSAAAVPEANTFIAAPPTTNPAAASVPASAAAQATAAAPAAGSNLLMDFLTSPLVSGFEDMTAMQAPLGSFMQAAGFESISGQFGSLLLSVSGAILANYVWTALNPAAVGLASSASGSAPKITLAGVGVPEVSASMGGAASMGRLSIPQGWGALPQGVRASTAALALGNLGGIPGTVLPAGGVPLAGLPLIGGMANAARGGGTATSTGAVSGAAAGTRATPATGGGRAVAGVSNAEVLAQRDELNNLRRKVAEMRMRRDTFRRSAASVIQRVKQGNG